MLHALFIMFSLDELLMSYIFCFSTLFPEFCEIYRHISKALQRPPPHYTSGKLLYHNYYCQSRISKPVKPSEHISDVMRKLGIDEYSLLRLPGTETKCIPTFIYSTYIYGEERTKALHSHYWNKRQKTRRFQKED